MRTRDSCEGSAYLVTLLALLILTMLGLLVSAISGTEILLGASERSIERSLYAADSGLQVALVRAAVLRQGGSLEIGFPDSPALTPVTNEVSVTPMVPVLVSPCNLCQVNQGREYFEVSHVLASESERRVGSRVLARSLVSTQFDLQPEQPLVAILSEALAGATEIPN